jgi:hypothetical protein
MQSAKYYRDSAARARRLATAIITPDVVSTLEELAQGYEDIATDLENGAVTIVHPEMMPQQDRPE